MLGSGGSTPLGYSGTQVSEQPSSAPGRGPVTIGGLIPTLTNTGLLSAVAPAPSVWTNTSLCQPTRGSSVGPAPAGESVMLPLIVPSGAATTFWARICAGLASSRTVTACGAVTPGGAAAPWPYTGKVLAVG